MGPFAGLTPLPLVSSAGDAVEYEPLALAMPVVELVDVRGVDEDEWLD